MDGIGGGYTDGKVVELEGRLLDHNHHLIKNNNHHQHHYHQHQFFRQVSRVPDLLLGVIIIVVSSFAVYRFAYPFQFFPHSSYTPVHNPTWTNLSAYTEEEVVKLKGVFEKAAMEDKTVIITTLNGAWAAPNSLFDIFLESFRIGNQTERLLKHLVVVSMDQKAHHRCLALHPHCYALSTNDVDFSADAPFMTTHYVEMMWTRIAFLHFVLKMGYNFIFTDTDIMWFRDPFLHFYSDVDFQIACDFFWGDPSDLYNQPNGGFNYVKSNKRTIQFYNFWYTSREVYPGLHDQDVLNKIKFDPFLSKIGLKMRFLDTTHFSGFCQLSKDLNHVCTMHANCCIGLGSKLHDLNVTLEDWRRFLSLTSDVKASPSWTVPQSCSLTNFHLPHSRKELQQGSNN